MISIDCKITNFSLCLYKLTRILALSYEVVVQLKDLCISQRAIINKLHMGWQSTEQTNIISSYYSQCQKTGTDTGEVIWICAAVIGVTCTSWESHKLVQTCLGDLALPCNFKENFKNWMPKCYVFVSWNSITVHVCCAKCAWWHLTTS